MRAGASLERGQGAAAVQMLAPALRTSLTRDEELTVRSMLAEAALLQDDLDQAASALGRPPDTFRDTVPPRRLSTLWRLHGRLASARGDQSRAIAHARARAEASGGRARLARDRTRALRARPVLSTGRRRRHRARAHQQGRLRAARGGRPSPPRPGAFAVEHLACAARSVRRGDGRPSARRAACCRCAGPGRPRHRLRQPGQRDDAAAPVRTGARARRAQRVAARIARFGPWPRDGARDAGADLRPARRSEAGGGGVASRPRRAEPDSVPRDDRRGVRYAGADSSHARRLRHGERLPGPRQRSVRRLRAPDKSVVRVVRPGARRPPRPAARGAGRRRRARRRDSPGRRPAVRRTCRRPSSPPRR